MNGHACILLVGVVSAHPRTVPRAPREPIVFRRSQSAKIAEAYAVCDRLLHREQFGLRQPVTTRGCRGVP